MSAFQEWTLPQLRESYDWRIIFGKESYGASDSCRNPHNPLTRQPAGRSYGLDDIEDVIAVRDGENDGEEWLGLFKMKDGRFLYVFAGCDYTGWDCQSDGGSEWTSTLAEAIAAMPEKSRTRLGLAPALSSSQGAP